MRHSVRRAAALVVAPALTTLALVAAPNPASAAPDPAPATTSAGWLAAQLTGGIVHNDQYDFDDIGLSADVALGLDAVGGHDSTVAAIADAIAPRAHDEWYTSTYSGVTTTYAGSLAKAAVLAQAAGDDARDFGGEDLISLLEGRVSPSGVTHGRVEDEANDYGDTNTFGQAYAAQALAASDSASAGAVTDYLLDQQCAAGWFRLDFPARTADDQTCDSDATSQPDTDATAVAVLALAAQAQDVDVAERLELAKSWLESTQKADGSFGGGPSTEGANANSTGLAGTALGQLGDTGAAARAATWVRAHQVTNVAGCAPYAAADAGAVAYDDASLAALAGATIGVETRDQFRRATAQALPVLQWAPAGTGTNLIFTAEYVRAGTKPRVGVTGAAPGEALCATAGGKKFPLQADQNGEAQLRVALPSRTATTTVRLANASGVADAVRIKALGAKKLRVVAKAKVRRTKHVRVVVRGLAPAESVRVLVRGKARQGQATRKGVFVAVLKVTGKPGKARVVARGEFANRRGVKTIKVVR